MFEASILLTLWTLLSYLAIHAICLTYDFDAVEDMFNPVLPKGKLVFLVLLPGIILSTYLTCRELDGSGIWRSLGDTVQLMGESLYEVFFVWGDR